MKKIFLLMALGLASVFALGACNSDNGNGNGAANGNSTGNIPAPTATMAETPTASNFATNREINVVSREAGSGTRGAFIELTGIEVRTDDGTVDQTSSEAYIAPGTSLVLGRVSTDTHALGYVSLGSLNDTVRAVPVDGVMPSVATIQNGSYPLFRDFVIAVPSDISPLAEEFLTFMLSAEGQEVVGRSYIAVDANAPSFASSGLTGTITVLGSTSVAPVMEHLKEAFEALNPGTTVEVQSAGSSAGINAARDGLADLGMSSRDLNPSELEVLESVTIAHDGLAVIANHANPVYSLTMEEVRQIFVGQLTRWDAVID